MCQMDQRLIIVWRCRGEFWQFLVSSSYKTGFDRDGDETVLRVAVADLNMRVWYVYTNANLRIVEYMIREF
mgnify:CR=1 FL=1